MHYQSVGNPFEEVIRFNQWKVDELIYLNISNEKKFRYRSDSNIESYISYLDLIKHINVNCFMPLTWGGGIRSADEAEEIISCGADKVSLNSLMFENPSEIEKIIKKYGSQVVVGSVDVRRSENNEYIVYSHNAKKNTGMKIKEWIKFAEKLGVGELLIQSIDNDGECEGYDLNLLKHARKNSNLNIIFLGGVGSYDHFVDAAKEGASGLAAANIWHFKELVDIYAKKILKEGNINVR